MKTLTTMYGEKLLLLEDRVSEKKQDHTGRKFYALYTDIRKAKQINGRVKVRTDDKVAAYGRGVFTLYFGRISSLTNFSLGCKTIDSKNFRKLLKTAGVKVQNDKG